MKKILFVYVVVAALLMACSQGKTASVKFTDLPGQYQSFKEDKTINNLEKNVITYQVTEMGKYDAFFKKSAVLRANVEVSQIILDKALAAQKAGNAKQARLMGLALVSGLKHIALDSKDLIGTAKSLVKSAKNDFKGRHAMKLPGILSGLQKASVNIKSASTKAPDLLKQAQEVAKVTKQVAKK